MINGEEISIHMEDMIRENEDSATKPPLLHPYSLPTRLEKVKKMQLALIFSNIVIQFFTLSVEKLKTTN